MKTTVVNIIYDVCDVYIGRSKTPEIGYFGNPYHVGVNGTREEVIAKYLEYFNERNKNDKEFHRRIVDLIGKRLGCFCKPEACHGDIIAKYLNFEQEELC